MSSSEHESPHNGCATNAAAHAEAWTAACEAFDHDVESLARAELADGLETPRLVRALLIALDADSKALRGHGLVEADITCAAVDDQEEFAFAVRLAGTTIAWVELEDGREWVVRSGPVTRRSGELYASERLDWRRPSDTPAGWRGLVADASLVVIGAAARAVAIERVFAMLVPPRVPH